MTKGTSTRKGNAYGNVILGNKDQLMISYRREFLQNYTMDGACGVLYQGEIHFFGGRIYRFDWKDFSRQHFVIEAQRSDETVKMRKKEDLDIGFSFHSCSSFELNSLFQKNVIILCFADHKGKSCYFPDN